PNGILVVNNACSVSFSVKSFLLVVCFTVANIVHCPIDRNDQMIHDVGQEAIVLGKYPESFFKTSPMVLFRHSPYLVFRHNLPGVDSPACAFGGTYNPVYVGTQSVA